MTQRYYIVGAPKCGTTTLAYWLEQTESVFMTPVKEPHYYSTDYVQDWAPIAQTKQGYLSLFEGVAPYHAAIGEASTNYLWSEVAIENILRDWPDAKFVVCLRNPADMARSLHGHHVYHGHDPIQDFEAAWAAQSSRKDGKRLPRWMMNPQSLQYSEVCAIGSQLDRMFEHVRPEQVHFVFLEDMAKMPEDTYRRIVDFLGATESEIDFSAKNVTRGRRSHYFNVLNKWINSFSSKPARTLAYFVRGLNSRFNITDKSTAIPPSKDFMLSLKSHFVEEVEKVEKHTNRCLAHWKT